MTSLSAVLNPLVWFVGGFLGGCLATYLILNKIAQATHPLERPVTPTNPPPAKPKRRVTALHVIGVIMLVLTIVSAAQSWVAQQATTRLTECLVTYANRNAEAIEVRSKANTEERKATVQMWRTVFGQPQTDAGRAEARRLFEDYLNKAQASINAQQANPFPDAPRDLCPDSAR